MKRCMGALASAMVMVSASAQVDLLPDITVTESHLRDNDIVNISGRTRLRLSNATPNIGDGKLYMRGGPVNPDGTQQVLQRIYRTDGSFYERVAGSFVYHPQHNHIHIEDWARYRIREKLPNNGVGAVVAEGAKTSFCLLDLSIYDPSLPNFDADGQFFSCDTTTQGISVGWMDIYSKHLAGQFIDVTDVPDGEYWLESNVDPENAVLELNEDNNVARIAIWLDKSGNTVKPDVYEPNDGWLMVKQSPVGQPASPNFGPCWPLTTVGDLTMHAVNNYDYFRFYIGATGTASDYIRIEFSHAEGNLGLILMDEDGTPLASSFSNSNFEQLPLSGRARGWYNARIEGAENPDYTLKIDPPTSTPASITTLTPPLGDTELHHGADALLVEWTASHPQGNPVWVTVFMNTQPILDGNEQMIVTTLHTPAENGFAVVNSAYVDPGTYWVYCRATDGGSVAGSWSPGTVTFVDEHCDADFNGDGFLSGDDYDLYVAAFMEGMPEADFNGDSFVTGDDFDEFVVAFEEGC